MIRCPATGYHAPCKVCDITCLQALVSFLYHEPRVIEVHLADQPSDYFHTKEAFHGT